ncbi:Exosome complex exonuclease RRP45 [Cricetulus griseus]|uniref:Exosome complex exonuclease RRP45 n=1 Tax=Cricetulus griseus TaxID=10029 RepID=G3I5A1_CRIGR|nr:Exosome complex exonuclease RRP45 [Cricetulus griseus]
MEMGAFRLMILISSYFYFRYFLQGAPIVLSDSEEEEMIILEPDKNPKKIRAQTTNAKEKAPSKSQVKRRKKKRTAN